jgi:NAD(P)-dependent dehydrogenase (short-subunit alcohol dehydrogenase family)
MFEANVMVTGASAGVGRAVAQAYGRRRCRVGLIARDPGRLAEAAAEVEASGGRALVLPLDVANAHAIEAAAARLEDEFGPIDIWVNSAMATLYAPVQQVTPEEFARVTEVTYLGSVYGVMAALKRMRPRNFGRIVQVGSALAYRSIPLQSAYCGAKFAIRGFLDSLRTELIHDGIKGVRLTMVQLPAINTPQFDWARNRMPNRPQPVPPIFSPDAVAEAILRAAQSCPRELWLGWPTLKAIVGTMAAPRHADALCAGVWEGEFSPDPDTPNRPDNLFAPIPGPFGAHGRFGAVERHNLPAFPERQVRGVAVAAGLGLAAVGLGLAARRRRNVGTRA